MTAPDFVHLHVHSEYSLLDGANRIGDLVAACRADGQRAIALTDHGNMHGAIELYQAASKAGVKPIVGCEVYIARQSVVSWGSLTYAGLFIGLGGAGTNMLERIALDGVEGAGLIALNTDIRTLGSCLAGEKIQTILTRAPGNDAPIGGVKVVAESGWFAARPSGTENIYKIYAESFLGTDHLRRILEEAQTIVNDALTTAPIPERG